ncbi:MAG TPA: haloacid dehalogenase type II [Planosporangium sp.]|nr:haloacid dehalogenase type II [Planosporangium sp.]
MGVEFVLALLFDVNETLLDLSALDEPFTEFFGDPDARRAWFQSVLGTAMVVTAADSYVSFADIGAAAITQLARDRGLPLDGAIALAGRLRDLPPHPDVVPALTLLANAGARMATLTNSPGPVMHNQLRNAGLTDYFEAAISCDQVGALKPAPQPYHHAADVLGLPIGDVTLVAAHGWDIYGAQRAGARGAFVARPGQRLLPVGQPSAFTGVDLLDVARQIIGTTVD